MDEYVGWAASAMTMLAAMMTAANLGSRVTGWGFAVFTIGSAAWLTVGLLTGQTSLMVTNGFLFAVNLFGVWRWLGRQARYENGSAKASRNSRHTRNVATLFSAGSVLDAKVQGPDGVTIGTVVDVMIACENNEIAYVVIAEGGVAGAGERLRAIEPELLDVGDDRIVCRSSFAEFCDRPEIDPQNWPDCIPT